MTTYPKVLCYKLWPLRSRSSLSVRQGNPGKERGNEAEIFAGSKCEDIKTSLLSVELAEGGEQGATSLLLYSE